MVWAGWTTPNMSRLGSLSQTVVQAGSKVLNLPPTHEKLSCKLRSLSQTVVRAGLFILQLGSLSRTKNITKLKCSWLSSLSQSGMYTEMPKKYFLILFSDSQWLHQKWPHLQQRSLLLVVLMQLLGRRHLEALYVLLKIWLTIVERHISSRSCERCTEEKGYQPFPWKKRTQMRICR